MSRRVRAATRTTAIGRRNARASPSNAHRHCERSITLGNGAFPSRGARMTSKSRDSAGTVPEVRVRGVALKSTSNISPSSGPRRRRCRAERRPSFGPPLPWVRGSASELRHEPGLDEPVSTSPPTAAGPAGRRPRGRSSSGTILIAGPSAARQFAPGSGYRRGSETSSSASARQCWPMGLRCAVSGEGLQE